MKTSTVNQVVDKKVIFSNSYRNRKIATNKQTSTLQIKREELKTLSAPLLKKLNKGKIETINSGLQSIYAKQGHTKLKTLREWNNTGFKVKKGENALLLWGKKKTALNKDEQATTDTYKFNPICFVFSQLQVEEREVKDDTANN